LRVCERTSQETPGVETKTVPPSPSDVCWTTFLESRGVVLRIAGILHPQTRGGDVLILAGILRPWENLHPWENRTDDFCQENHPVQLFWTTVEMILCWIHQFFWRNVERTLCWMHEEKMIFSSWETNHVEMLLCLCWIFSENVIYEENVISSCEILLSRTSRTHFYGIDRMRRVTFRKRNPCEMTLGMTWERTCLLSMIARFSWIE